MKTALLAVFALGAYVARATTLTTTVSAHEDSCFHIWVERPGQKVAFYFAVQSGGSFDVDYRVVDPSGGVVLSGTKERQGDYAFAASQIGEYSFCFSNRMSTFTAKNVDFDITLQDDRFSVKAELPANAANSAHSDHHWTPLEESLFKLSGALATIARNQDYFRTREHRNQETVKSTESRIYWYSVIQSLMIVGMAAMQVFVVRTFFRGTAKARI